jgi:hypothetical protein
VAVDVVSEIEIDRPREEVAAFAADPANATAWYKNIKSVEWETTPPLVVGSRMRFRAQFLADRSSTPTRRESTSPAGDS